jgi:hypothetical protein
MWGYFECDGGLINAMDYPARGPKWPPHHHVQAAAANPMKEASN